MRLSTAILWLPIAMTGWVMAETDTFVETLQKQALPELIHSLSDQKKVKKLRVVRIEGDVDDLRATPYLIQAYEEATLEGIRCKLLQSIGRLHDPALFGWLVLRLKDPSIGIQCFAIWALGELRTPRARNPLLRKLWSANPFLQMTAIDALGKTGRDRELASWLDPFLQDNDVQIRFLTAKALTGVAGPDAVPELLDRLRQEPSLDVQEALAGTIGQIGGSVAAGHFIELLKNPLSQATEHWAGVGLASAKASIVVPALAPLVDGSDFRVKVSALRILSDLDVSGEDDPHAAWIAIVRRWAKGADLVARQTAVRLLERVETAARGPERTMDR